MGFFFPELYKLLIPESSPNGFNGLLIYLALYDVIFSYCNGISMSSYSFCPLLGVIVFFMLVILFSILQD